MENKLKSNENIADLFIQELNKYNVSEENKTDLLNVLYAIEDEEDYKNESLISQFINKLQENILKGNETMITNKKKFLKAVKKDFPSFIDDKAIIDDAENQLCINGGDDIEFKDFDKSGIYSKLVVKLYHFEQLKNGKYRFV